MKEGARFSFSRFRSVPAEPDATSTARSFTSDLAISKNGASDYLVGEGAKSRLPQWK